MDPLRAAVVREQSALKRKRWPKEKRTGRLVDPRLNDLLDLLVPSVGDNVYVQVACNVDSSTLAHQYP